MTRKNESRTQRKARLAAFNRKSEVVMRHRNELHELHRVELKRQLRNARAQYARAMDRVDRALTEFWMCRLEDEVL